MATMNMRLEERHDVHIPVYVTNGDGKSMVAILCDLSRSGGRLRMGRELSVGADISVKLADTTERTAAVRRCVLSNCGRKFEVGIELTFGCWPEELLSLATAECR